MQFANFISSIDFSDFQTFAQGTGKITFFCFRFPVDFSGILQLPRNMLYLLSHRLCFFIVLNHDLFVNSDGNLRVRRLSCEPNNLLNVLKSFRTEGDVGALQPV